jgi:hypothetical protein
MHSRLGFSNAGKAHCLLWEKANLANADRRMMIEEREFSRKSVSFRVRISGKGLAQTHVGSQYGNRRPVVSGSPRGRLRSRPLTVKPRSSSSQGRTRTCEGCLSANVSRVPRLNHWIDDNHGTGVPALIFLLPCLSVTGWILCSQTQGTENGLTGFALDCRHWPVSSTPDVAECETAYRSSATEPKPCLNEEREPPSESMGVELSSNGGSSVGRQRLRRAKHKLKTIGFRNGYWKSTMAA